jgi:hypothetical protein
MFGRMRRLHPRGAAARGIVVDADGAMLGPDCVLVRRTPRGCRVLPPDAARVLQAALLGERADPDWLFDQCLRIAGALDRGEAALARIYGLHIPIVEQYDLGLRKLWDFGVLR